MQVVLKISFCIKSFVIKLKKTKLNCVKKSTIFPTVQIGGVSRADDGMANYDDVATHRPTDSTTQKQKWWRFVFVLQRASRRLPQTYARGHHSRRIRISHVAGKGVMKMLDFRDVFGGIFRQIFLNLSRKQSHRLTSTVKIHTYKVLILTAFY